MRGPRGRVQGEIPYTRHFDSNRDGHFIHATYIPVTEIHVFDTPLPPAPYSFQMIHYVYSAPKIQKSHRSIDVSEDRTFNSFPGGDSYHG